MSWTCTIKSQSCLTSCGFKDESFWIELHNSHSPNSGSRKAAKWSTLQLGLICWLVRECRTRKAEQHTAISAESSTYILHLHILPPLRFPNFLFTPGYAVLHNVGPRYFNRNALLSYCVCNLPLGGRYFSFLHLPFTCQDVRRARLASSRSYSSSYRCSAHP